MIIPQYKSEINSTTSFNRAYTFGNITLNIDTLLFQLKRLITYLLTPKSPFIKIKFPMVKKPFDKLISLEIISVQPMTSHTNLIFLQDYLHSEIINVPFTFGILTYTKKYKR